MIHLLSLFLYIVFSVKDSIDDRCSNPRVFKPLLMPVLLVYYLSGTSSVHGLIVSGLVFGWIGDLCLLHKAKWFKAGLAAFLLGHLCYTAQFLLYTKQKLHGHVSFSMRLASKDYMCVIALMSFTALLRLCSVSMPSFPAVWAGSLLFCVSDQRTAWREFLGGANTMIMERYVLAQFLIVTGYLVI